MPRNFTLPLYCTNIQTPSPLTADQRRLTSTSPGTTDSVLTVIQGNLGAGAVFLRPEQSLAVSTNNPPPATVSPIYGWIFIPSDIFGAAGVRLVAGTFTVAVHYTRNGGLLTANFAITPSAYICRLNAAGTVVEQVLGFATGTSDTVTEAEKSQNINISTAAATFATDERLLLAVYIQKASAALTEFRLQTNSTTGTRITAAPGYQLDYQRSLSDSFTVTDSISRQYMGARALSDSQSLTDSLARMFSAARSLSDSQTLADSLARAFTGARTLTDAQTLADSLTRTFTGARSLSDTQTLTDTLTRQVTYPRALADAQSLVDSLTRQFIANRAIADFMSLTDSLARTFTGARSLADTMTLVDTLTRQVVFARLLEENYTTGGGGDIINYFRPLILFDD